MVLPNVSDKKVVDEDTIEELAKRDKDGEPLLGRLFGYYVDETPRLLGELERALAAKDKEACYDAIHQMKGSAAAMGANRVFTITEAALHICKTGSILEVDDLVGRIEEETDLYIRDLSVMLSEEQ